MAEEPTQPQSPSSRNRRSSFAGQTFADLFGTGRPSMTRGPSESKDAPPAPQPTGPISQAAQQAQQRRMSLTTLGLSGSPNQTSPFNTMRARRDSIGSNNSGSFDESAVAEDDASARDPNMSNSPSNNSFQRRTSFGARALRDIRTGSFGAQTGGGAPGSPGQNGTKPPSSGSSPPQNGTISSRDAKGRGLSLAPLPTILLTSTLSYSTYMLTCLSSAGSGEGFNWSENLRTRAERTSIAGPASLPGNVAANQSQRKSVAVMEPPPVAPPKPKEKPRPDHFQERILKGDFYMD